ncbi:MAG TPA: response regulator [Candidatus Paceibacterota bacterium]|nr:response regulator [Candidatus Paceibacterota bacterium]
MADAAHKVLLVDDDKFLADMYSMKFTQSGFEVTACLSVAEALAALKKGLEPSAILFDIVMPVQDGFSFLQSLRQEGLGLHAVKIALSNQSDEKDRARAIELGADRYVVKASMIPSEVVTIVAEEIKKKTK